MSFSVGLCRENLLQHIFQSLSVRSFSRDLTLSLKGTGLAARANEELFCVLGPSLFSSSEGEGDNNGGGCWPGEGVQSEIAKEKFVCDVGFFER
jgi:hypothetical protein